MPRGQALVYMMFGDKGTTRQCWRRILHRYVPLGIYVLIKRHLIVAMNSDENNYRSSKIHLQIKNPNPTKIRPPFIFFIDLPCHQNNSKLTLQDRDICLRTFQFLLQCLLRSNIALNLASTNIIYDMWATKYLMEHNWSICLDYFYF